MGAKIQKKDSFQFFDNDGYLNLPKNIIFAIVYNKIVRNGKVP